MLNRIARICFVLPLVFLASQSAPAADPWANTNDRIWAGGEFWANPMEDWKVADGGVECISADAGRSIHSITKQLAQPEKGFTMSVGMQVVEATKGNNGGGFRLGVRSELNEYRSNCFAGGGIDAGVVGDQLTLGGKKVPLSGYESGQPITLSLTGKSEGDQVALTLKAVNPKSDELMGEVTQKVAPDKLLGNVALMSHFGNPVKRPSGKPNKGIRHRFTNWQIDGDAFDHNPDREFGPILWSMYSLSDSRSDEGFVLKMSALTGPMGEKDNLEVELQVQSDGSWKKVGAADLDKDAWVAIIRIPKWDASKDTPYKLIYREKLRDGGEEVHEWGGTVKANPTGRPLRMAAMTCQNDYGFPYEPVANNVAKLDPDLAYFSGDQIYESHGGFGIIRRPADRAILNYLRKYYQFGWAFREVMRNCPTLVLPDDHDVFHGNIWGEGGAPAKSNNSSSSGGYIEPVRMVNAVHRTTVGHHPDPYDPTPIKQDMSVYYGDMVYGGVSFAILADRQWKSGPEHVDTGKGRKDHVVDKNFDCSKLDKPGLVLLGERQEQFLKEWASDWRGHKLKAVLSQTVFAGVATHHGGYDSFLKADLDSGGWPQTARNRAINIMRPAMPLHINGDQHLTTLVQYGVETQRDSFWSFCTPAIAAGYPRWWRPDDVDMLHINRPQHGLANTGEYADSFGNYAYVYAVGNPEVGKDANRYKKAHEKGSGFGFITFDTEKKTYTLDSYRFLIDATDGKASNQFPGWPVTIQQKENKGENVLR